LLRGHVLPERREGHGFGRRRRHHEVDEVEQDQPGRPPDFSSFLLQAQASDAQILGLANAGGAPIN
ncbi:hypothetical protein, partial [Vibrio cholerae]|uniref:hypothetical protein n=1 Tax=Vibrio cholerae TaxID=666 RepID=UPI0019D6D49F